MTSRNLGEMSRDLRAWLGQAGMTSANEDLLAKAAEQVVDEDDPFI
jgi:hypothetical protein